MNKQEKHKAAEAFVAAGYAISGGIDAEKLYDAIAAGVVEELRQKGKFTPDGAKEYSEIKNGKTNKGHPLTRFRMGK